MNPSYLFIVLPILSLIVGAIVSVVGYRKWRAKGIFLGIVTFLVLSVILVTTVIPAAVLLAVTDPTIRTARETAAKDINKLLFEANKVLKQLPSIENAELVIDRYTFDGASGCNHGQVNLLYGTSLDPVVFSDKLAQQLQTAGWTNKNAKSEHTREFVQGENTQFSIEYDGDFANYWKQQGYEKEYLSATTKYANVLNARIDYFEPSRAKCTQ